MKIIKFYLIIYIYTIAGCTSFPETDYTLPSKKIGDDPEQLTELVSFRSAEAEKLYSEAEIISQKSRKEKTAMLKKAYSSDPANILIWISLGRESGEIQLLEKAKDVLDRKKLRNNSVYAKLLCAFGVYYSVDAESHHNSEIHYMRAEEFLEKAAGLSEELNEKEILADSFHFLGVNFRNYMQAYLPNRAIKDRLPKLKKAVESLEKEYFLLQKTELSLLPSFDYRRSVNLLELSLVYRDRWIYETGKPEENIEEYKNRTLKTVLNDYKDHKISRLAAEKAYAYAKEKNHNDIIFHTLEILADSHYITDPFEEQNHSLSKGRKIGLSIANFRMDQGHTDREKAAKYYMEAADLAEKKGYIKKSVEYRHQAAMIYSENMDQQERKKIFTENITKLEGVYSQNSSSQDILNQIYKIKTEMGINYVEKFETEEEIRKYYSEFINDRRFTVQFFLNNHYHMQIYNNPRRRLAELYAEKGKYCEALKWQTEYALFLLMFDSDDIRADLDLKEYQEKCSS